MDLESATLDDIVGELNKRFPDVVVLAEGPPKDAKEDASVFHLRRRASLTTAIGLVQRAWGLFMRQSEEDFTSDDLSEDEAGDE
jgi:hypothetical protein